MCHPRTRARYLRHAICGDTCLQEGVTNSVVAIASLPAIATALRSIETLLVVRHDVLRALEQHAAADATADTDADVARLTATAERLAADLARLLAELERLVPPDGERA